MFQPLLSPRAQAMRDEFDKALEEGYQEAYQMVLEERTKAENLELDLYDQYQKNLTEFKAFVVDKVDEFLDMRLQELEETNMSDMAAKLKAWREMETSRQAVERALEDGRSVRDELRHAEAKCVRLTVDVNRLSAEVNRLTGSSPPAASEVLSDVWAEAQRRKALARE